MKKNFDQQMFEFFSIEEAFVDMYEIAEQLPNIKSKLIDEFWPLVVAELETMCIPDNNKWTVLRLEPTESNISKLMLYKNNWGMVVGEGCPQLAVCYERLSNRPFYGPFVHARTIKLDYSKAYKHLRDFDFGEPFRKDNSPFYPFFNFLEPTFLGIEDFISILPSNRQSTCRTTAETLYKLAQTLEGQLDYVSENFKK